MTSCPTRCDGTSSSRSPYRRAIGGTRVGRAFRFNELMGDSGIGAGLEISYRLGANSKARSQKELFAFVDGGVVQNLRSAFSKEQSRSLASAGVGTRFSLSSISISLEGAIPLRGSRHHSPRPFVSLFRTF